MVMVLHVARSLVGLSLFTLAVNGYDAPANASTSGSTAEPPSVGECEARTINYITHTLPQLCPTSTWRSHSDSDAAAANATTTGAESRNVSATESQPTAPTDTASPTSVSDEPETATADGAEGSASPFMSFEDWKEMMLKKTGQDPQDLRSRRAASGHAVPRDPPDTGHYGMGDEDEIALDFGNYLDKSNSAQPSASDAAENGGSGDQPGDALQEGDKPFPHRSKDAGKTCKERFSYSSFDAGATVLKTGPNTKNAKAILVENKDTYMLLECAVANKYVIVELSDDILIDTIVMANFEFFSSMFRHFRVSISDRYPVKMERWRDIGTFQARNSRDVQAFLVENPQIWAKYLRIEFLSHYGNEFYCPVSLLRVHGSRMLDSWKDTETVSEEELLLEAEERTKQAEIEAGAQAPERSDAHEETPEFAEWEHTNFTLWAAAPVVLFDKVCLTGPFERLRDSIETREEPNSTAPETPSQEPAPSKDEVEAEPVPPPQPRQAGSHQDKTSMSSPAATPTPPPGTTADGQATAEANSTYSNSSVPVNNTTGNSSSSATKSQTTTSQGSASKSQPTSSQGTTTRSTTTASQGSTTRSQSASSQSSAAKSQPAASQGSTTKSQTAASHGSTARSQSTSSQGAKQRGSGSSSASPGSPPVQEGFFNSIAKRLQNVESNLTFSLQYLEGHSKYMQEALQKAEQKQLAKVSTFLDNLNRTVMAEVRGMRDQYDEIWQSTVFALESQKKQVDHDIVALSSRLNLLADEVVFQKRMAIVQAVLLLSCLILVIFSRGMPIPYLAPLIDSSVPSYTGAGHVHSRPFNPGAGHHSLQTDDALSSHSHRTYTHPPSPRLSANAGSSRDVDASFPEDLVKRRGSQNGGDDLSNGVQLSPPHTPNLEPDSSLGDASTTGFELHGHASRRLQPYPSSHNRKPLPALPEHPSPELPSSPCPTE